MNRADRGKTIARNPRDWGTKRSEAASQTRGSHERCLSTPACYSLKMPVLAAEVALLLAGCSVLSPRQDLTRFIILTPATSATSNGPQSSSQKSRSLAIGVGPVQLPEYLDRPELVIRTSPNGFELSETDRWAEPLSDNLRHVLASDLANLLGNTNMVQFPWDPGTRLDYIVHLQFQRFEVDKTGNAKLSARWELNSFQGDQLLASRDAKLSNPSSAMTGDAAAAALSQDVAELAEQIASAIAQLEQQRVARAAH
jgi:uncharacterized protein